MIAFLLTGMLSNAQVGIGTTSPNASSVLDLTSTTQGLLLPRIALTGTANATPLSGHVAGMLVYNTATVSDVLPGLYLNDGTKWGFVTVSGGLSPTSGGTAVISAVDCSGAVSGTLTEGIAASGVTKTVTATVATAGSYSVNTPTVNGITWSATGTFAGTGTQTITLTSSGTPTAATTSTFTLSTTPSCSFNATTALAPDAIRSALSTNQAAYIAAASNTWVAVTKAEFDQVALISGAAKYGYTDAAIAATGFNSAQPIGTKTTMSYATGSTGTNLTGGYIVAVSFIPYYATSTSNGFKLKYGTVPSPVTAAITGLVDYPNSTTYTNQSAVYAAQTQVFYVLKKPTVLIASGNYVIGGYSEGNLQQSIKNVTGGLRYNGTSVDATSTIPSDTNPCVFQVIGTPTKTW